MKYIGSDRPVYAYAEANLNSDDVCPDFDAVCFEPNRSGCEDGKSEPLIGICPMWDNK